jgi:hypothetical protein
MNPERQAEIHAGLPVSVPALTVNRVLRFGIARGRWGYRMGDRQPYDSMQRHRRGRVMEGYVMDGGSTQCAHASALLQ